METEDHLPRTMSNDARIRPAGKRTDDGKRAGACAEAAQAFQDARLPGQRRSDGESVMTGAGFWSGKKVLVTGGGGFIGSYFFFQAEDGIRDYKVTGVQTCALPI